MVLKNLLATIFVFLSPLLYSGTIQTQGTGRVIGTICNEKIIEDKLFICEYGTQVCRMTTFEPRIEVDNLIRTMDPQELKIGWYVEAEIDSNNHLRRIKIEQHKTIICFLNSIEKESNYIKRLLENTNGIKSVDMNTKSSQASIEYDQFTISYNEIVKTIKDANFEIE
jgi:copper chaperone CopZ